MKFYSELTKKFYNTTQECEKAEVEFKKSLDEEEAKKKAEQKERKEMAQEVSSAYDDYRKALQKYEELRNSFVKKFGTYHMTITDSSMKTPFSIFEDFFSIFN